MLLHQEKQFCYFGRHCLAILTIFSQGAYLKYSFRLRATYYITRNFLNLYHKLSNLAVYRSYINLLKLISCAVYMYFISLVLFAILKNNYDVCSSVCLCVCSSFACKDNQTRHVKYDILCKYSESCQRQLQQHVSFTLYLHKLRVRKQLSTCAKTSLHTVDDDGLQ